MKNIVEYILFSFFSRIFCLAGFKKAHIFVPFITFIFYDCLKLRKAVVLKNLSIAFPELTESEKEKLARECYKSSAQTFIEIMAFPSLDFEEVEDYFSDESNELAIKAYEKGKGVILLSGHFGNWEIFAMGLSKKLGIPFSIIIQPQRNDYVTEWMNKQRTKWGNKKYKTGNAAMTLFKSLKNGEIIAIVGDQRGPEDGLRVPFFGRMSAVNEGTAALSLKTGAPILFSCMVRQPDNSYKYKIHEISTEGLPDSKEGKIEELTRRHTQLLEEYIRKYPSQWLWMHNRWKY